MHKSSQTMKEAQTNGLYKYEFVADKSTFQLDRLVFKIENAWVENNWKYECIDNEAKIVKDSTYQFVIEPEYKGDAFNSKYLIGNNHLGAVLDFSYSGQDTFKLTLYRDTSYTLTTSKQKIYVITFVRQQVSR